MIPFYYRIDVDLCIDEGMLKPTQIHRVRCLENACVYQMLAISDLRNHLANHHLKPEYKTTEEKKFNSFAGKICMTHIGKFHALILTYLLHDYLIMKIVICLQA